MTFTELAKLDQSGPAQAPQNAQKPTSGVSTPRATKTTPLSPKRTISKARGETPTKEGRVGERPVSRPVDQSVVKQFILVKTAFYLPEDLSDKIDEAVSYLRKEHKIKKVDRSTFLSALLNNPELWDKPSLDKMIDGVIKYLTSRATGRPVEQSVDQE